MMNMALYDRARHPKSRLFTINEPLGQLVGVEVVLVQLDVGATVLVLGVVVVVGVGRRARGLGVFHEPKDTAQREG